MLDFPSPLSHTIICFRVSVQVSHSVYWGKTCMNWCKLLAAHALEMIGCYALTMVLLRRFRPIWSIYVHFFFLQEQNKYNKVLFLNLYFNIQIWIQTVSLFIFRLQHHRMCPGGVRSLSGGECSPDESGERADGETLLSVTDSDSDLDVWDFLN